MYFVSYFILFFCSLFFPSHILKVYVVLFLVLMANTVKEYIDILYD